VLLSQVVVELKLVLEEQRSATDQRYLLLPFRSAEQVVSILRRVLEALHP